MSESGLVHRGQRTSPTNGKLNSETSLFVNCKPGNSSGFLTNPGTLYGWMENTAPPPLICLVAFLETLELRRSPHGLRFYSDSST